MRADVIVQFMYGTQHNGGLVYIGQSFSTPAGGPWNNISFNFFADSAPYSTGTAFLLTQVLNWSGLEPYGTPLTLDSTTPGFVASSVGISNGRYVFDPSVTLQPATTYYLYDNDPIAPGAISGGAILIGQGSCCTSYFAWSATSPYFPDISGSSANFQVDGYPVPEPSTIALVPLSLITIMQAGSRRRVQRRPEGPQQRL